MINENSTKPVFIKAYYDDKLLGTATGFQVRTGDRYLITNWHVVSGKSFIDKECIRDDCAIPNKLLIIFKKYTDNINYIWIEKQVDLYDENNNKNWHEHPTYGSNVDVVAIKLDLENHYGNYDVHHEFFDINTRYFLNVTENVFVMGFPLGYTIKNEKEPHAIWTSGSIASDPPLGVNINNIVLPAFLIDSKTREGQSGSPVVYYSEKGLDSHCNGGFAIWGCALMQEVGIYSGRIHKDSDLGYVWKWEVIKEIIDSIK